MNTEPQQRGQPAARSMKKKMLLVLGILAILLVLMLILATALENWLKSEQIEQPSHGTPQTIIFHTPNYEEDITKDKYYMNLDRQIYFADAATGVTISLSKATYAEQGEGVELLCHMIEDIIAGDHEAYNEYFSDAYYEEVAEKEMFTAQKLYNIKITRLSTEDVSEGGKTYTREMYELEYMIYQNNGTFRTDVGSDAIRKQGVVLTDREGELLIDALSSYTYSYS